MKQKSSRPIRDESLHSRGATQIRFSYKKNPNDAKIGISNKPASLVFGYDSGVLFIPFTLITVATPTSDYLPYGFRLAAPRAIQFSCTGRILTITCSLCCLNETYSSFSKLFLCLFCLIIGAYPRLSRENRDTFHLIYTIYTKPSVQIGKSDGKPYRLKIFHK